MTIQFIGFALGLINIILLFLCLSLYKDIISVKLLTQQLHQAMAGLAMRNQQQEILLQKLSNSFNEFTNLMGNVVDRLDDFPLMGMPPMKGGGMVYRTLDGKYAGSSLEDLMKKIKDDGAEGNYLSEEEIEQLRRMFNEDDMEDDSDDDFNPDKGKF